VWRCVRCTVESCVWEGFGFCELDRRQVWDIDDIDRGWEGGVPYSFVCVPFTHRAGDFLPGGTGDLGVVRFDDGEEEFHFVFGGPGWHFGCVCCGWS